MRPGHNSNPGALMDADKIAHELSERGLAWSDANAAAEALEETQKSVLSELMVSSAGKSQAEKEMLARATPEFREHVLSMVSARRTANRARVRYDTYKVYVELLRTNASTERALATLR